MQMHKHEVCTDQETLDKAMEAVLAQGGEGMMVKDPECDYIRKRTNKLLKVKKFQDTEATVVGHQKGTGRCTGMLGALECVLDNGIDFKIGSGFNDLQRMDPPKIGARVTFKYMGLSESGRPRFPIYLREHPGM